MEFKNDVRENLRLALDTVRAHKLRSFLAVLGVMIGVTLIILVVGMVDGFRNSIEDQINSSGANSAWAWRLIRGPATDADRRKSGCVSRSRSTTPKRSARCAPR